jgi:hypothetical protein
MQTLKITDFTGLSKKKYSFQVLQTRPVPIFLRWSLNGSFYTLYPELLVFQCTSNNWTFGGRELSACGPPVLAVATARGHLRPSPLLSLQFKPIFGMVPSPHHDYWTRSRGWTIVSDGARLARIGTGQVEDGHAMAPYARIIFMKI